MINKLHHDDPMHYHAHTVKDDLSANPKPYTQCPLGEDCDLTIAYMAGHAKARQDIQDLRQSHAELLEAAKEYNVAMQNFADNGDVPYKVAFDKAETRYLQAIANAEKVKP